MLNRALPWKRGRETDAADAGAPSSERPASRRPRAGRGGRRGASDGETAATRARRGRRERRRQLIAVIVGAVLILTILAVVGVGVWQQYLLPPGVTAGEVRDVRFTMGDLVERIRVLQGINRYEGGRVDFSRVPFQLLTDLLHAEILRQAAPGLNIDVTAIPLFQTEMPKICQMRSPSTTRSRSCNSGRGLTVLTMEYSATRAQKPKLKRFVTTACSIFVRSATEILSTLTTGSCRSRSYHALRTILHIIKC